MAFEMDFDNGMNIVSSVDRNICMLLRYKISGISEGTLVTDDLIGEAEDFIRRNLKEENHYHCCQRCLKAHLIKKADELELGGRVKRFINRMISGEAGHNGYYMDGDKLIRI